MDAKQWSKDRNEALISMDKEKIKAYCKKYKIKIPDNEEVFWGGVHKAICNLYLNDNNSVSKEQYDESYKWLAKHNSTPSLD